MFNIIWKNCVCHENNLDSLEYEKFANTNNLKYSKYHKTFLMKGIAVGQFGIWHCQSLVYIYIQLSKLYL